MQSFHIERISDGKCRLRQGVVCTIAWFMPTPCGSTSLYLDAFGSIFTALHQSSTHHPGICSAAFSYASCANTSPAAIMGALNL